jgi:hypothetical protein
MNIFKEKIAIAKRLKVEDVYSAYHGYKEGCRCGCNGRYFYASQHKDFSSKQRGYKIEEKEINNKRIKQIFQNIMLNIGKSEIANDFSYINFENNGKPETIYLLKKITSL